MSIVATPARRWTGAAAFDIGNEEAYRCWRDWKLARQPVSLDGLIVDVHDPRALTAPERAGLLACIGRAGFALYRSQVSVEDGQLPRRLGAQLGMQRLDANWLAEEDGVSRITVCSASDGHGGFIPYTDRPLGWHTDGYYHPQQRRIRGMVLHCVRPAQVGGENSLLDPELAYIALRDRSPRLAEALMQPDAMTIPARTDERGVARPAQAGPVFSVDEDSCLHMRYTARTRSIEWKKDDATQEAAAQLSELLKHSPAVWRVRLDAGMGLVGHNVLHERSAFQDDPERPRLLLRARFLDRVRLKPEDVWRNG
jgi:alpha-ketoglutarate-dependent taurine dioxygenase